MNLSHSKTTNTGTRRSRFGSMLAGTMATFGLAAAIGAIPVGDVSGTDADAVTIQASDEPEPDIGFGW